MPGKYWIVKCILSIIISSLSIIVSATKKTVASYCCLYDGAVMLQQFQLTLTPNTYTKNLPKQMPWKQPPILMQWIYYILKTVIVQHNHTNNSTSTNAPNSNSALSMLKSSKNYTHWNLYISLKTKKMIGWNGITPDM